MAQEDAEHDEQTGADELRLPRRDGLEPERAGAEVHMNRDGRARRQGAGLLASFRCRCGGCLRESAFRLDEANRQMIRPGAMRRWSWPRTGEPTFDAGAGPVGLSRAGARSAVRAGAADAAPLRSSL